MKTTDQIESEAVRFDADILWGTLIHDHATRFIDRLADGAAVTWQTFDDAGLGRSQLNRIIHGKLARCWPELVRLNEEGAGVYVMFNQGDGAGRRAENVKAVRALFLDLDGAPLLPTLWAETPPHLVTHTSPGRYQCIWMVEPVPPDAARFAEAQSALARRFDGDLKVIDLPRVCRVPGFWHRKRAPFLARLHMEHRSSPYRLATLVQALELTRPPPPVPKALPAQTALQLSRDPEAKHNYAQASLDSAVKRITDAPDGTQHETLNREAYGIGQLAGAGVLPMDGALGSLIVAGRNMPSYDARRPWSPDEVERQITRAFRDGQTNPRKPT